MTPSRRRSVALLTMLMILGIVAGGLVAGTGSGSDRAQDQAGTASGDDPVRTTTTSAPATSTTTTAPDAAVTAGAARSPGVAGGQTGTTGRPAGASRPQGEPIVEQPTPDGRVIVDCVGGGTLELDTVPSLDEAIRLCGERFPSFTDPPPLPVAPVPLHIERSDWPTGYGRIIGSGGMPPEQVSCQLTWFLTLSDGRVIERSRTFPLAGLTPGTHSATWSSDPEFGAYPSPKTYEYIFNLDPEGNIGFILC